MTQPSPPVDLRGTVWSATRNGRTTYVTVTEAGPTHAFVRDCNVQGQVFYVLARGFQPARKVQLSHEGTRVKGRKQVQP